MGNTRAVRTAAAKALPPLRRAPRRAKLEDGAPSYREGVDQTTFKRVHGPWFPCIPKLLVIHETGQIAGNTAWGHQQHRDAPPWFDPCGFGLKLRAGGAKVRAILSRPAHGERLRRPVSADKSG
jgi:hypothetical protein